MVRSTHFVASTGFYGIFVVCPFARTAHGCDSRGQDPPFAPGLGFSLTPMLSVPLRALWRLFSLRLPTCQRF